MERVIREPAVAGGRASAAPPATRADRGWRAPLALLMLLAAAAWLGWPALRLPFFADDFLFLDAVRGRAWLAALLAPDPIGNFHRPVSRQLYFWLVARAGGESPAVFHAVNLGLWLAVLALSYSVARRLAGARAALIAAGLLAMHYAADVPVRWASGSQDLLAVAGALAAIRLHIAGRRALAGAALLLAALSKEVVLLAPVVAVIAEARPGESWSRAARRGWPLGIAVGAWGLLAFVAARARGGPGDALAITPGGALAALAHLAQVSVGLEWRTGGFTRLAGARPPVVPLAIVLAALAWVAPARGASRGGPRAARAIAVGLVWALAGTLPIAPVAAIWSAYYYLFALCGVALALGAWLAPRPPALALAVVAIVASGSARSSALDQFAPVRDAWSARSHINRFYIARASSTVQRYLRQLRAARPVVPPRSTLFFAGLAGNVGFQTGDGPVVRWSYRDTSLRSYFATDFDAEKATRGPLFFFEVRDDSLSESEADGDVFYRLASGSLVSDRPASARAALLYQIGKTPEDPLAQYWLAWIDLDGGDRASAIEALRRAGVTPAPGPAPELARALAALRARDTVGALGVARLAITAHALDPGAHALLSDLYLVTAPSEAPALVEAYAARALAPEWPGAWRRWGMVQLQHERYLEAVASFEHYFSISGDEGARDAEAHGWVDALRRKFPAAAQLPAAPRR